VCGAECYAVGAVDPRRTDRVGARGTGATSPDFSAGGGTRMRFVAPVVERIRWLATASSVDGVHTARGRALWGIEVGVIDLYYHGPPLPRS